MLRLREELLALVAHDLGGPLTAIKSTAELLQRQATAGWRPAQRVPATTIAPSCQVRVSRRPVQALLHRKSATVDLVHGSPGALTRSWRSRSRASSGLGRRDGPRVETAEQVTEQPAPACDEGQGYHFARPQPGEFIERLFQDGRAARGAG